MNVVSLINAKKQKQETRRKEIEKMYRAYHLADKEYVDYLNSKEIPTVQGIVSWDETPVHSSTKLAQGGDE